MTMYIPLNGKIGDELEEEITVISHRHKSKSGRGKGQEALAFLRRYPTVKIIVTIDTH
jgi:hypothetical protein